MTKMHSSSLGHLYCVQGQLQEMVNTDKEVREWVERESGVRAGPVWGVGLLHPSGI